MKVVCYCFLLLFTLPTLAAPRIAFLNPATPSHPFWEKMTDFMQAVAQDLDIHLDVYYMSQPGITNRFEYFRMAQRALSSQPDYLLFINLKGTGLKILQASNQAKVPAFIFNSDILPQAVADFGQPRGRYPYWIGHLRPDDTQAGFALAEILLGLANTRAPKLFGLNGSYNSSSAKQRSAGLQDAVRQHQATLLKITRSNTWSDAEGRHKTHILLQRFPETELIWAASDSIALGAIEALTTLGRRDILVGGIDWSDEGIRAVQAGSLSVSIGGHFIGGGVALLLLSDHYHGFDFADKLGTQISLKMSSLTQKNVKACAPILHRYHFRQIDFKRLTQQHGAKHYNLSLAQILSSDVCRFAP